LVWQLRQPVDNAISDLEAMLTPFKGGRCTVVIEYSSEAARATLQLGDAWRVRPTDELLTQLRMLFTEATVKYR
jgi:DNA polymerase-3 subunit alpha